LSGFTSGTVFRFPLRREASPLSPNVLLNESFSTLLKSISGKIEGSLIFGLDLRAASIQHWKIDASYEILIDNKNISLKLNDIHAVITKKSLETSVGRSQVGYLVGINPFVQLKNRIGQF